MVVKDVSRARTWTAGLGKHIYLAERFGVDRHVFVWTSICDVDFGEGAFEEVRDGLWALVACVFATVDHRTDELGGGVGAVSSTHDGQIGIHVWFLFLVARLGVT